MTMKKKDEKANDKINRSSLIEDLKLVNIYFKKEFPEKLIITRDFYRNNTKLGKKNAYYDHFGSFDEFIKQGLGEEKEVIQLEKRIYRLETENNKLKKDKKELMSSSIESERIINMFDRHLDGINLDNLEVDNSISHIDHSGSVAVLNLNDWHLGECVISEEVYGINDYNADVLVQRADKIFKDFIEYCEYNKIKKVVINFLGDLFSGEIHDELKATNDLNIVEALFFAQEYIIKKLVFTSEFFNDIKVNLIAGNHSRLTTFGKKPFYKKKAILNWEYVLGRQIEIIFGHLNNTKIKIDIPKSPFKIQDVNGCKFLLMHGDILSRGSGGFAGLPFYGLCMSAAKMYGLLSHVGIERSRAFKHIIIGHYHTSASIPIFSGGKLYISACLIGTNEFSMSAIKAKSMIEQLMLIVDKNGKITQEINLRGLPD